MSEKLSFSVVGSSGGKGKERYPMCIYLPENTLIDGGNIFSLEDEEIKKINTVILTHSHLDHVCDIPFLLDYTYEERTEPLRVYALPETLRTLKDNIFNEVIWPAFDKIKLKKNHRMTMEYIQIYPEKEFFINGYRIYPILSNHTVPTISILVKNRDVGFLYTSDSYKNPNIWRIVEKDRQIKVVLVDVSFPSSLDKLAETSLHNTPNTLKEDILKNLSRRDIDIYAVHLKPAFEKEIMSELLELRKSGINISPLTSRRDFSI